MTLEEAKLNAEPVRYMGQTQFIVGTHDNCRVITGFGIMGSSVELFNGITVLSSRSFAPTDYANGQMSKWHDRS